jgi:uncharacterized membrane protein
MSPAAEALLRQLIDLPAEEREAVVNALRASLDGTSWALQEPNLSARYGTATEAIDSHDQPTPSEEAELNRRLEAARSGEVTLRSSEEVLDELRRKHNERKSRKGIIV